MAWHVNFELHPEDRNNRETYAFKSQATLPTEAQNIIDSFARDLLHLLRHIELQMVRCNF